jgi:hypothetical protein
LALVGLGLFSLAGSLAFASWQDLRNDPIKHLFGFVGTVNGNLSGVGPGLYALLIEYAGRTLAGIVGVALTIFGALGLWLPAFLLLGRRVWRSRLLCAADSVPCLLLAVASVFVVLAPMARNGDITEYRHRALPLLVVVISTWTLDFVVRLSAPRIRRLPRAIPGLATITGCIASLIVLDGAIAEAKRPRMTWASDTFYGTTVVPEMAALVPLLTSGDSVRPRFAIAHQPPDARLTDDAARLVALSAVPAYVSSPVLFKLMGDPWRAEAERRMAVLDRLAVAPSLDALLRIMKAEGISHYVVTQGEDAPFDPDRRAALGRVGSFAVYRAIPASPP